MSIDKKLESTEVLKWQIVAGRERIHQGFAEGLPLEVASGVAQVTNAQDKLVAKEAMKKYDQLEEANGAYEGSAVKPMRRNQGFTLIELLVCGALLASVTLGGYLLYQGSRALNKYVNTPSVQVERVNVVGDNRAEKFIEFNGERFYSEVDGKRVENLVGGN